MASRNPQNVLAGLVTKTVNLAAGVLGAAVSGDPRKRFSIGQERMQAMNPRGWFGYRNWAQAIPVLTTPARFTPPRHVGTGS